MKGVIGLLLLIIGLVFLYDVASGKARNLLGLLNNTTDALSQPKGDFNGKNGLTNDTGNTNNNNGNKTITPDNGNSSTGIISV